MNTMTDQSPPAVFSAERNTQKLSTHEVYAILRQKILEHEIPPATKVNIHHLSKELGVSPTPVREALRLLQGDNLLVATSNKGYTTTELLDDNEVRHLFEFRLLIEPWATRMAASNSLSNPAHFLRAEMEALGLERNITRQIVVAHDNRFHHAILNATGNTSVVNAYEQSHCHLHLFRLYHLDAAWEATMDEHQAILDAIAAHDPDAAEEAMRHHLHSAYIRFATRRATGPTTPLPMGDIPLGNISA